MPTSNNEIMHQFTSDMKTHLSLSTLYSATRASRCRFSSSNLPDFITSSSSGQLCHNSTINIQQTHYRQFTAQCDKFWCRYYSWL